MQLVVNQKYFHCVVEEGCVHLLIYSSFESKVCLFVKHGPWHLKLPHRKSSPWGQPASTLVKLNAVTNASNYPPLLIAIKGLFVSMLVLTKSICFSEYWSADLLVFLSVSEQESSRHISAQRKVKWPFFVTTNGWHGTDNQERLQWGLLRVWSLHCQDQSTTSSTQDHPLNAWFSWNYLKIKPKDHTRNLTM